MPLSSLTWTARLLAFLAACNLAFSFHVDAGLGESYRWGQMEGGGSNGIRWQLVRALRDCVRTLAVGRGGVTWKGFLSIKWSS